MKKHFAMEKEAVSRLKRLGFCFQRGFAFLFLEALSNLEFTGFTLIHQELLHKRFRKKTTTQTVEKSIYLVNSFYTWGACTN